MYRLPFRANPRILRNTAQVALALGIILGGFPLTALAQEYVPPDRGLPGRREGGGTRGSCVLSQPSLTALTPTTNFGTTTAAYPTFLWYVPQTRASTAEFVLLDDAGNEVYSTTFRVTGESGIVSLSLPENATLPPLTVGKDYHWYFSIVCDPNDRSGDVFAEGWIQRITPTPDLVRRLEAAPERDRPAIYAASGIWYDAVSSLALLYRDRPQDQEMMTRWRTLLNSVGLANLADMPIASQSLTPEQ